MLPFEAFGDIILVNQGGSLLRVLLIREFLPGAGTLLHTRLPRGIERSGIKLQMGIGLP